MQNMLAPLPEVMLHRLSLRDFSVAAVIITQFSIHLFYLQHETNSTKFFEFTRECAVHLHDINTIHSVQMRSVPENALFTVYVFMDKII